MEPKVDRVSQMKKVQLEGLELFTKKIQIMVMHLQIMEQLEY